MDQIVISDSLKEKLDAAETMDEVVRVCDEEGIEVTKDCFLIGRSQCGADGRFGWQAR